ncbi:MAG: 50S ribosomal protein L24 [Clostridiales bacterium]|jgi:large subunit ribosomal protein L24|nr:50S ribosomal protein L24 [Clostridiales bacterium]
MNKLKIKSGDTVVVITGEDKGKKGKILNVNPTDRRVIVQNANMITRHTKPRKQGEQGGRIEKEAPLNASNVMLVCPKCSKPTRVGYTFENDKKFRTCKKCGKHID